VIPRANAMGSPIHKLDRNITINTAFNIFLLPLKNNNFFLHGQALGFLPYGLINIKT